MAPEGNQLLPSSIYNITPGTQLLVTLAGLGERLKTSFIGLERGRYFLFKTPQRQIHNGIYDYLYSGNEATISFLYEGNIWSFVSRIQSYIATPYPLVFVDFPSAIESHNLRKEHRIECYFPVQVFCGDTEYQAMIQDLSRNGCGLSYPVNDAGQTPALGDTVIIESPLFGAVGERRISGVVRRAACESKSIINLGLTFNQLDPKVDQWIKNYLAQVIGLFSS
ncbi:MAG: flagellar brake protein [Proteobacteria bacterium]|nr:flagellar brake protein [Pseudomonadota bacterium]